MRQDNLHEQLRLERILKSINAIESFTKDHTLQSFSKDEKSISACLYQYASIGKSIDNLNMSLLEKHGISQSIIKAFNSLAPQPLYDIEPRIIWDTTADVLPGLKKDIQKIIEIESL